MVRVKDIDVMEHLRKNARKPAVHIANALGVTETAIRKRIKKLEKNGTIYQYTIRTNHKQTGEIHAFIGVDTEPEEFMNLIDYCKKQATVRRAYTTSGDHSMQLKCVFANHDAFTAFVRDLEKQPGITKVCPGIITDTIK